MALNQVRADRAAEDLRMENVSKVFHVDSGPDVVALDGVSFTVPGSTFVSLVGASGSGKSTLLRIIDGLIEPTSGSVYVGNEKIGGPGPNRAMVFQQDRLLPWATIRQNVAYGLRILTNDRELIEETTTELLRVVGLEGFGDAYPRQLSGGMRQRANLARALAVDPQILLLDEPFAALDGHTRELMQEELMSVWSQRRKTCLFVTHQIDEAVYLSDKVVVFSARPGRVRSVVDVALPRPRTIEMKRSAEFGELVAQVWSLIESDVRRSMQVGA